MCFTKFDEHGAYIEVPDDDRDLVTLEKRDGQYYYKVRGEAIDKLRHYEEATGIIKEWNVNDTWFRKHTI